MSESCGGCVRYRDFYVRPGTSPDLGLDRFMARLEVFASAIPAREKAVKEVMAASRSSYLIDYDGPLPDGKYHKIRVTCSRKAVRLQVKKGYYAN
jgi:hypothetical protein